MCHSCRGARKQQGGSRYSRRYQHAPAYPPQPRRSMFRDAASIAGGVTVGTAVGHVAGEAITGLFSGRRREEVVHALPRDYHLGSEPSGPCAYEIQQFLNCASNSEDIAACQAFNDALRECKRHYLQFTNDGGREVCAQGCAGTCFRNQMATCACEKSVVCANVRKG